MGKQRESFVRKEHSAILATTSLWDALRIRIKLY